ncbi:hypothetical protein LX36DRAFT_697502 [Colletotrichum falcatum]|nr:hypothetical protein LX36DRAFT_697502 [Colletotrichum falcatum]
MLCPPRPARSSTPWASTNTLPAKAYSFGYVCYKEGRVASAGDGHENTASDSCASSRRTRLGVEFEFRDPGAGPVRRRRWDPLPRAEHLRRAGRGIPALSGSRRSSAARRTSAAGFPSAWCRSTRGRSAPEDIRDQMMNVWPLLMLPAETLGELVVWTKIPDNKRLLSDKLAELPREEIWYKEGKGQIKGLCMPEIENRIAEWVKEMAHVPSGLGGFIVAVADAVGVPG